MQEASFRPLSTFMRKGKDQESNPDPYLWLNEAHKHVYPDPQHLLQPFQTFLKLTRLDKI